MVVRSLDLIINPVKLGVSKYAAGLIATIKKKNCTQMGRELSLSHDQLYRTLRLGNPIVIVISKVLLRLVLMLSAKEKGWLIVDDTLLAKTFGSLLPGLDFLHNASTGQFTKGLSMVTIAWTNGRITIPLSFKFWFSKNVIDSGYKTKIQLSQDLIADLSEYIDVKGVLLDGLYASKNMMKFLNARSINFEMRMASNRVIDLPNGKRMKIRDLRSLRPMRNARSRTIAAKWNGINVYLTSEIRINKRGGKSVVFLVSNYNAHSKNHVEAYKLRWNIEMIFRTSKQSLGLEECSSRKLDSQTIHIYLVFLSYAFLQNERILKGNANVEALIKAIQSSKSNTHRRLINRLDQFFRTYA